MRTDGVAANELLSRALDIQPDEWTAFLERVCPDDEKTRTQVLGLLEETAREPREPGGAEALGPGQRIGPYRVLRHLGQGGMGTVYLAVRTDGDLLRRVALKVLKEQFDRERAHASFRREQQIMAGLEHPGIARLYDAGMTEKGQGYLAMEYVEGELLDSYCFRQNLPFDERLRLFLEICDAVAYAHRNLVIHRDIKPSNILVDGEGAPKLLDFGIARLLEDGESAATVTVGPRALTPAYASPEQLLGQRVTTGSDVFSLGALFYKLLVVSEPFPRSLSERLEVLDRELPAPSQVASEHSELAVASRELAGDLDAVVLKALARDPADRYLSVSDMTADLHRFRSGVPVLARRQSGLDRLKKFARRNKASVFAGASIAAGLIVAVVSLLVMTTRVSAEKAIAESQRDRANRVTEFVIDIFEVADPTVTKGEDVTVREALDRAAASLPGELQDELDIKASLQSVMGRIYLNLSLFDSAAPLLTEALHRHRELLGSGSEEALDTGLSLAQTLTQQADFVGARDLLLENLEVHAELWGHDDPRLFPTMRSLVATLYRLGDFDETEAWIERASRLAEAGVSPADILGLRHLQANVLMQKDRRDEAFEVFERAIEEGERALGASSVELTGLLKDLAKARSREDPAETEKLLLRVLAIEEDAYPEGHVKLGFTLNGLGHLYRQQGQFDQAERYLRRGLELRERLLGSSHPATAVSQAALGSLYREQGRFDEAEGLFAECLGILVAAYGPDHAELAYCHTFLYQSALRRQDLVKAEHHISEVLRIRRLRFPADHRLRIETETQWIQFLQRSQRLDEARDARASLLAGISDRGLRESLEAKLPAESTEASS